MTMMMFYIPVGVVLENLFQSLDVVTTGTTVKL
jgi:hypothetical protein